MNNYAKCVSHNQAVKVQPQKLAHDKKRQIGIMIGNFDPVNNAHLLVAEQIRCKLNLDEIWFAATGNQAHAAFQDRTCMLEEATRANRYFKVNVFEALRKNAAMIVPVLEYLTEKWPENKYFLLIGSDQVNQLQNFKGLSKLLKLATLVGVRRLNYIVSAQYPLIWVDVPVFDISGTAIRQAYANGLSLRYLVPDAVIKYIEKRGLYRD